MKIIEYAVFFVFLAAIAVAIGAAWAGDRTLAANVVWYGCIFPPVAWAIIGLVIAAVRRIPAPPPQC
jgi:hypothetical protein